MEEMKLFNKWSFSEVEITTEGMKRYIDLTPMVIPHTGGRTSQKQFSQSKVNVIERLVNKLMRSGQGTRKVAGRYIRGRNNTGKKQKVLNIVEKSFDIVAERTKKNPLQVLIDAIVATGPREETTSIIYGGIRYHKAVDVSSQRRVDFGLKNITLGAFATSFKKQKSIEEALADEIIWSANADNKAYSIQRKEETERIAKSSR